MGLPVEHCELDKKMRRTCLRLRAKGIRWSCRTAFAVGRDILARVVPSRASGMGPTSSIPHGKNMLVGDCSLWLEFSAAGVEGVSGFLAEGSPHSPSECGGMVSEGVRSHPLECLLRGLCEGRRICNRHHIDSSGVSFVTVSRVFQEGCSPPGVSLALVGWWAGVCVCVCVCIY